MQAFDGEDDAFAECTFPPNPAEGEGADAHLPDPPNQPTARAQSQ